MPVTTNSIRSGGGVAPHDRVIDEHLAVVPVFGDLAGRQFGVERVGRVDEHHGDAVAVGPVQGLDGNSVRHFVVLHDHQRFGIEIRSLSPVIRSTHARTAWSRQGNGR